MTALRAELKKVAMLGWTYLVILGMNAFSAAMLLIFVILYLKSSALDSAAQYSVDMARQAGGLLYFVFVTETWVFSFLGFFFLGVLIGEIVGREFDGGSIGMLFLSPHPRWLLFASKFAVVVIVYFVALLLNLCIQAATVLLFSRVHEVFLRLVDPAVLLKLFAATVLIDLSWIALMFLMATLSRGVATTLFYTLFVYCSLLFVDAVIWLGAKFEFLQGFVVKIGGYSFTNSCRVLQSSEIAQYFLGKSDSFPVAFNLLGLNVAYALLFIGLACYAFSKREI